VRGGASTADIKARMDLWGVHGLGSVGNIVALLRSEEPLQPKVRKLIADALEGTSEFVRLEVHPPSATRSDKTVSARLTKTILRRQIGEEMFILRGLGVASKQALNRVATKFAVSEKKVEAAFTDWKAWHQGLLDNAAKIEAEIEACGGYHEWAAANGLSEKP